MGGSNIEKKAQKIVSIMIAVILQVIILSNSSYAADDSAINVGSNDDQIKVINVNEANPSDISDDTQSELLEEPIVEAEVKEIEVKEEEKEVTKLEPEEESGDDLKESTDIKVEEIEEPKVEVKKMISKKKRS